MLVVKIVFCILTFIAIFIARRSYENKVEAREEYEYAISGTSWYKRYSEKEQKECENNLKRARLKANIEIGIASILGIVFCVLLISTHWNLFTIPKILLFISVCLYILFKDIDEVCIPFRKGIVITIIACIISLCIYGSNIKEAETPDVKTSTRIVVCAKDNSSITGSMSGGIFYVEGSVSEKSVYKYYYKVKGGGIKLGSIPASSTTIYFVKAGEEPHLDTIVKTTYTMNYNNNPATIWNEESKTTYKLYIPEESIQNVYEFNAE